MDLNMELSENFKLGEFLKSQTATRLGISNYPTDVHLNNLKLLAERILQEVRDNFGPVIITSGYRSRELNEAIGGSEKSQHSVGQAADFEVIGHDNKDVARWISENLDFDQLILEGYDGENPNSGWIHCSYKHKFENRNQILIAKFVNGKAHYNVVATL